MNKKINTEAKKILQEFRRTCEGIIFSNAQQKYAETQERPDLVVGPDPARSSR